MKLRKITSLTALLSFILMLFTSIILYIVPHGRVAYWSDWSLMGLDKTQWGDVHINMGLLFLLSIGLHIYYNWKTILAYLKDKARRLRIWTPAFNVGFVLTGYSWREPCRPNHHREPARRLWRILVRPMGCPCPPFPGPWRRRDSRWIRN